MICPTSADGRLGDGTATVGSGSTTNWIGGLTVEVYPSESVTAAATKYVPAPRSLPAQVTCAPLPRQLPGRIDHE
jgi:hypothetical protein